MADIPPLPRMETFEQQLERIAHQPRHVQVPARKVALDLSPTGILDRLESIMDEAHKRQIIPDAEHREMMGAIGKLKGLLQRIDESQLLLALQQRK